MNEKKKVESLCNFEAVVIPVKLKSNRSIVGVVDSHGALRGFVWRKRRCLR